MYDYQAILGTAVLGRFYAYKEKLASGDALPGEYVYQQLVQCLEDGSVWHHVNEIKKDLADAEREQKALLKRLCESMVGQLPPGLLARYRVACRIADQFQEIVEPGQDGTDLQSIERFNLMYEKKIKPGLEALKLSLGDDPELTSCITTLEQFSQRAGRSAEDTEQLLAEINQYINAAKETPGQLKRQLEARAAQHKDEKLQAFDAKPERQQEGDLATALVEFFDTLLGEKDSIADLTDFNQNYKKAIVDKIAELNENYKDLAAFQSFKSTWDQLITESESPDNSSILLSKINNALIIGKHFQETMAQHRAFIELMHDKVSEALISRYKPAFDEVQDFESFYAGQIIPAILQYGTNQLGGRFEYTYGDFIEKLNWWPEFKAFEEQRQAILERRKIIVQHIASQLNRENFIDRVFRSKFPALNFESEVMGNGSDWNVEELDLLAGVSAAVPVMVYDNGAHAKGSVVPHKNPFPCTLLFFNAPLLKKICHGTVEGAGFQRATVLSEGGRRVLNKKRFYELYKERLLPLLLHANEDAKASGQKAFITLPGAGSGVFAGDIPGEDIKQELAAVVKKLLVEHEKEFSHIQGIYYDSYSSKMKNTETKIGETTLICRSSNPNNENFDPKKNLQQLMPPSAFGKQFKNCKFYSGVAWDAVAAPGNDGWKNNRKTDDGVKNLGTDLASRLCGIKGVYIFKYRNQHGQEQYACSYLPAANPSQEWQAALSDNGLEIIAKGRIYCPEVGMKLIDNELRPVTHAENYYKAFETDFLDENVVQWCQALSEHITRCQGGWYKAKAREKLASLWGSKGTPSDYQWTIEQLQRLIMKSCSYTAADFVAELQAINKVLTNSLQKKPPQGDAKTHCDELQAGIDSLIQQVCQTVKGQTGQMKTDSARVVARETAREQSEEDREEGEETMEGGEETMEGGGPGVINETDQQVRLASLENICNQSFDNLADVLKALNTVSQLEQNIPLPAAEEHAAQPGGV